VAHRAEPSKLAGRYSWATIFPKQAGILELPRDNNAWLPLAFAVEYAFNGLADIAKTKYAKSKRPANFVVSPFPRKLSNCTAAPSKRAALTANVRNPTTAPALTRVTTHFH
jgi:hypothetical protein